MSQAQDIIESLPPRAVPALHEIARGMELKKCRKRVTSRTSGSGQLSRDRSMLLTVILADAINLGLAKMAEACPGTTFHKLDNLRAWHVRDETYSKALAEIVNYQHRLPFAAHWGAGTTSKIVGSVSFFVCGSFFF